MTNTKDETPLQTFGALIFDTLWENFTNGCWEIEVYDLITETAVKAGLVEKTAFDPEQHDDPDGACVEGDEYYVISDPGRAALKIARAALTHQELNT